MGIVRVRTMSRPARVLLPSFLEHEVVSSSLAFRCASLGRTQPRPGSRPTARHQVVASLCCSACFLGPEVASQLVKRMLSVAPDRILALGVKADDGAICRSKFSQQALSLSDAGSAREAC